MARLKGPVPIIGLIAVLIYAVVSLTEPAPPAAGQAGSKDKKAKITTEAVDPRSLERFPRYQALGRDGFTPLIVAQKLTAMEGPALAGGGGSWALTGISTTNGITSALLENGSTHDTVFVRRGEQWNGLTVTSIEPTSVVFRDKLGHDKRVTFAVPTAEAAKQPTAATAQPMMPGMPGGFPAMGAGPASAGAMTPAASTTTPVSGRRAASERQGN